jgi:hypothetical protein
MRLVVGRAALAFHRHHMRRNRLHGALRPTPMAAPSHKRRCGARCAASPKEWWTPEARVRDLYTDCTGSDVVQLQQLLHLEGYIAPQHVTG